jgi:hypothetical protein
MGPLDEDRDLARSRVAEQRAVQDEPCAGRRLDDRARQCGAGRVGDGGDRGSRRARDAWIEADAQGRFGRAPRELGEQWPGRDEERSQIARASSSITPGVSVRSAGTRRLP